MCRKVPLFHTKKRKYVGGMRPSQQAIEKIKKPHEESSSDYAFSNTKGIRTNLEFKYHFRSRTDVSEEKEARLWSAVFYILFQDETDPDMCRFQETYFRPTGPRDESPRIPHQKKSLQKK